MSLIKKYNMNATTISDIVVDTSTTQHLWVAFSQNSSGNCLLKKVSAHNPLQTYFNISIETDAITRLKIDSSKLYVALNDSAYIAKIYSVTNPLSSVTSISIPSGITEAPVDLLIDSYLYILLPGDAVGVNSKICKFSTAGVFSETINLTGIKNATSFTIDSNDNIWVCTNTSPANLVRVYNDSGWQIETTVL